MKVLKDISLDIVIPLYNDDDVMPLLCDTIFSELDGLFKSLNLILVDDGSNDNTINQYGAADQAKNMLVNLTEMPFVSLEQTLGGKYEAGDGGKTALMSGAGTVNANEVEYNGQSVAEYLLDFVISQIPVDPQGNINKAVIDKFIENIPSNLIYSKNETMAERLDRKIKEQNFFNSLK